MPTMRPRSLVSIFSAALLLVGGTSLLVACSKQSEGERCSIDNYDDDCEDGLVCNQGICCPPNAAGCAKLAVDSGTVTDTKVPSEGGADTGPVGVDTALKNAGDPCTHSSECAVPLVCGAGGKCATECAQDRDCTTSARPFCQTCGNMTCQATPDPNKRADGTCNPDAGTDAGTDTATTDTATTDTATTDAAIGDAAETD
jgi:hypothetical protein